jgi:hypothetical protein
MPFGLGFFATAGAGAGAAGSYDLLETQVLGGSSASVTFSSLSTYAATYQHLQIRAVSRLDSGSGDEAQGYIRFNGDSGTNYSGHWLLGFGSGSPVSTSFVSVSYMPGLDHALNATAGGNFAASVIDILDAFETTKFKTIRSLSGAAAGGIFLTSGSWRNTNALTSITLGPPTNQPTWNLATGSRYSLYGLKAA